MTNGPGQVIAFPQPGEYEVPKGPAYVRAAEPADLLEGWPFIRKGLLKIRRRLGRHSYWQPEHIFSALTGGRANLFIIERERRMVGFLVTTIQTDPFLQVPLSLFVWIAYSEDGGVAEGHEYLEAYARERGLRYLEALTARDGLVRRMARHGWYRAMSILRKDLYEDEVA